MMLSSFGPPKARPLRTLLPTPIAFALLHAFSLPAAAQTAPVPAASAGTVVVTGTRTPTRIDQSLADVTVIDRTAIEQAAGRTLAELLARQPGIVVWSNGGAGKASSVSMRGLESRHTLLLIDGVRYGSATLGLPAWENIPLESIERIEIVRGPLSGLYGSDAVGGVVQVFTRRGAPGLRAHVALMAGSHRTGQVAGGLQFGHGDVDGAVELARREGRGISATNAKVPFGSFSPDDDGFDQTSGSARLGWRFADGWRLEAHALAADGLSRLDDGPGADAIAGLRTEVLGLTLSGQVRPGWSTTLRLTRSADDYETIRSASPFSTPGTTGTVQRLVGWEHRVDSPVGTVLVLAEHLRQAVRRPGAPYDVSTRTNDGLAAGLQGHAGPHRWQANLRRDHNSQFGDQTTGTLGYGVDLSPAWRLHGSLGRSFVQPSFNQLYFPGFGNPDLQPEEGRHAELGLRWSSGVHTLRATWFDNRIRGYIASGPLPTNIPRIRADGVTLAAETAWAGWALAASIDHVDPRNDTAGAANEGKLLPRRARNSLKVAADTQVGPVRLGGTWNAVGHRYDDAANTTRVAGHGIVDLRADWAVAPGWSLGLQLNNVGDKTYETVYGYNQPGREVFLTLRFGGRLPGSAGG